MDSDSRQLSLLKLQQRILRMVVEECDSREILAALCKMAEALQPGALASVIVLDKAAKSLKVMSAPSMPPQVIAAFNGLRPGDDSGASASAVDTNQPVFIRDVLSDSRCSQVRDIFAQFALRACWAMPIRDSAGDAIGSFALSSPEACEPSELQQQLLEVGADIVSLILKDTRQMALINQRQLERLAYYDQLTGLPNRQRLFDRMGHAINLAQRREGQLALLFLDIDRFKNLNDTFGHLVGDEVLMVLAKRLEKALREQDTMARLGGDEFVALLENIASESDVYRVAEKLLQELRVPVNYQGQDFLLNGSIGIALYPRDGNSAEQLLKHADTAMYMAKRSGGNRVSFYEAALTEKTVKAFSIESDLRKALNSDEFELYFQPRVNAQSNEIAGVETLLRWRHPQKGIISPLDFIPVAEETGLIVPIGEWVLDKTIQLQHSWRKRNLVLQRLSVNISGKQLNSQDIGRLIKRLDKLRAVTGFIELELTETFLMSDPELSALQLQKLNATGVRLSIDDFGSGYSSLGYLKRFKAHSLKIDRTLIRDIEAGPEDLAIVNAMVALAHSLDMTVVAEGVETAEQARLLVAAGCDELQGYHFYRPMTAEQFEKICTVQAVS